jgi:hypothetical protein
LISMMSCERETVRLFVILTVLLFGSAIATAQNPGADAAGSADLGAVAPGASTPSASTNQRTPDTGAAQHSPPPAKPFELVFDNFAGKQVQAYVDGGLKCTIPSRYHCILWVPDETTHSVHVVRAGGDIYDSKVQFPIIVSGIAHDGAAYIITDQRVWLELKPAK